MAVFHGRSGIFVLKLKNNKCRNKTQKAVYMYQLYQHLASFTNTCILITNVNVNIYIKN